MANRWLFAGAETDDVRWVGTPSFNSAGSGTRYVAGYAFGALGPDGSNYFFADFIDSSGASESAVTGETLWWHQTLVPPSSGTVHNLVEFVNGSDQPWLAIRNVSSGNLGLFYNSNTGASPTWTQIGSSWAQAAGTMFTLDVMLTLGSPHSVEVFANAVSKASGTFSQASLTGVDAVRGACTGATIAWMQHLMASVGYNTVGGNVFCGKATGAGSNSGWTGLFSAIDDVGRDDTDAITSGSAAQRSTFAHSNLPTLSAGLGLGDVFLSTRCKNDGASPTNVKPVRRDSGGTDNVGSSLSGIGLGYASLHNRYSGLSETEYNASEFGVESAA